MYIYICNVKLEDAIQSTNFKSGTHKAALNVLYTAWWLKTTTSTELKKFGLTHEQYNVLRILKGKHPVKMCVKDIAGRMIEKNSNVPRIIDRLDIKKLIVRSQGEMDGRQTVISLTQKGIDILAKATDLIDKMWDGKLVLTDKDATSINTLLEKMRMSEE